MTPDEKSARVEQIKLLATTVNTLGIAVVVSGVLLPTIAMLYGGSPPAKPLWWLIGLWWLSFGAGAHMLARAALGRIAK